MATISVSLPADGSTADVADVNTPITTIVNEFNGNIDNANIKTGAAIATAKLADDAGITNAKIAGMSSAKLANPYKFSAWAGANTTLGAGVFTKVAFNTEEYDTGSNYDNATNYRFVAPVAGFYQFNATVNLTSAGAELYIISLYKNGTEFKRGNAITVGGASTQSLVVSPPPFSLALNDYVEVFVFNNTGGGKTAALGQALTYFGGYLVSLT